ncbi:uncharacterized protein LOC144497412 isoform X2 [Mustelus asterias]
METPDRWKICLCLFVTVFSPSLGNSTAGPAVMMPSDTTSPAFNLSTTIMESTNSATTVASGNIAPRISIGSTVDIVTTPSLRSGTGFNSSANSTVSTLIDAPDINDVTKRNGMASDYTSMASDYTSMTSNDTSSDFQAGNETEIRASVPSPASSPSTKSVNVSDPVVTEGNGPATEVGLTVTTAPQQMETLEKMDSTATDSRHETTVQPATSSAQKESKANVTPTTQPPVFETVSVQPTSQGSTSTPTTVTSSGSGVISSTTVAVPTSRTRAIATVKVAATSSATIDKATTSFSVQHSEEDLANTKEMVNGRHDGRGYSFVSLQLLEICCQKNSSTCTTLQLLCFEVLLVGMLRTLFLPSFFSVSQICISISFN